tara:strand:- start:509 stop:1102 length:594 start_codon:yes stop_codon:yes gene_type:complete
MVFIYILKLNNKKYYVGKTDNPKFRLESHFNSNGSEWTKKYKPIECIELKEGDKYDEDKFTIKYMNKYGINNVRGGSFCEMKLSESTLQHLTKMIDSSEDKCFSCGEKGHFIRDCPYSSDDDFSLEEESSEEEYWECEYCNKGFDTEKGCLIHENKYCKENPFITKKLKTNSCYRCGRPGHYASNCYASFHIKGYKL